MRDSDGTLVLLSGPAEGGTALTVEEAKRQGKPCLTVSLDDPDLGTVGKWMREHAIRVLNVAGPRESECPGVYRDARQFLQRLLSGG